MHVYDKNSFDERAINCTRCGWSGIGVNANIIDFYGIYRVQEIRCPDCDEYLGGLRSVRKARSERGNDLSNQFG